MTNKNGRISDQIRRHLKNGIPDTAWGLAAAIRLHKNLAKTYRKEHK